MGSRSISLNFSAPTTPLRFSYGVDGNTGPQCNNGVSVAAELHSFGSTLIRTHDANAIDWPLVFPHPGLDVATDEPSNYDWTAADAYFRKIVDHGFEPYVRLGTSWGQMGGGLPMAGIAYNRSALVDVLLHTVMHLNDGWGGGFTGKAVKHFELWNEPDSSCLFRTDVKPPQCGRVWNRSSSEFYDLVDAAARAIKAYDPSLSVGTAGVANVEWPAHNPYGLPLIAELGRRRTPLDFFSWHGYIDQPSWYATTAAQVRSALDAAFVGERPVDQHVTEFFPCILYIEQDTAYGAAAFASALSTFVHEGVALATLYPLCTSGEGRTGGKGWGLFDDESEPGVARWRKLTHAYAAFGELAQSTPQLLTPTAVTPGVPSPSNLTFLAGRDEGGGVLKALLSSQASNGSGTLEVVLSGLGTASPWVWSVVALNNSVTSLEPLAGGVERPDRYGVLRLAFPLQAPAVALLRVTRVAGAAV
jgi:hypothetical protein